MKRYIVLLICSLFMFAFFPGCTDYSASYGEAGSVIGGGGGSGGESALVNGQGGGSAADGSNSDADGGGGSVFDSDTESCLVNGQGGGVDRHSSMSRLGAALFVATDGDDGNPGSEALPLATLAGARNKIRSMKSDGGLPEGGVTVYVRGGLYHAVETVCFDERDSGTRTSPVRYCAYPGESPVFTGGAYIRGADFVKVTDAEMLSRLYPDARGSVLCYDLFANGFTADDLDYSKDFWQDGNLREFAAAEYYENGYATPRLQVFIDDDALHLARYPNKTEGIFTENPYNQYLMIHDVVESGFDPVTEQPNGKPCSFKYYEDRVSRWKNLEDIIVFGMTGWEFFGTEVVAEKFDVKSQIVTLRAAPVSGVQERGRFAFANVFEELDRPGEYYIDKDAGVLYLYPTKDMECAVVKLSRFEGSYMIKSEGASYVTFAGLSFELTKKSVMLITGGENCAVEDCTFKNFGVDGVIIGDSVTATYDFALACGTDDFERLLDDAEAAVNGYNHRVTGCLFLNTGRKAAVINSGSVGRREPGGAVFENNIVRHSGLIGSCYFSGLGINGCGITVRNNTFMFCLGQAINGNVIDTTITYNEFCDSPCDMAEDTGAIYLNYLNQNEGVLIRYNYFHDITNRGHLSYGFGFARRGVAAYDNLQPFRDFSYNVVYNVPCIENLIDHISPKTIVGNIFIDCDYVLEYPGEFLRDLYGGEDGAEFITTDKGYSVSRYYLSGLYKDPYWRGKYPETYEFYEYMASEKKDLYPVISRVCDNLIVYLEKEMNGRSTQLPDYVPADPKYGKVDNNRFFFSDPGFADADGYDFQLSEEAAALYGFEWLDMSRIGASAGVAEAAGGAGAAGAAGVAGAAEAAGAAGAAGVASCTRVHERKNDPLSDVAADKVVVARLVGEPAPLSMVSVWREVVPGEWAWFCDSAVVYDGNMYMTGFPVKPGGTYTIYYPGDAVHPGQFMGGFTGASTTGSLSPGGFSTGDSPPGGFPPGDSPPDGVESFTVEPDHDMWDLYTFALAYRTYEQHSVS